MIYNDIQGTEVDRRVVECYVQVPVSGALEQTEDAAGAEVANCPT
jgi:hypothetical protein